MRGRKIVAESRDFRSERSRVPLRPFWIHTRHVTASQVPQDQPDGISFRQILSLPGGIRLCRLCAA